MKQFHLFADKNGVTGKKVCKQMGISFGFPFLFVPFRYREERGLVLHKIAQCLFPNFINGRSVILDRSDGDGVCAAKKGVFAGSISGTYAHRKKKIGKFSKNFKKPRSNALQS